MNDEELLYGLVNNRDESSLSVAGDLAIELNCGIPVIRTLLNLYAYNAHSCGAGINKRFSTINFERLSQAGRSGCKVSFVDRNRYKYLSYTGELINSFGIARRRLGYD